VNDLSEKEQLDMMRTWWSENGRYVIGGVVLGVTILFSWNQWNSSIAEAQLEASTMYEAVMSGVGDDDAEAASAAAEELFATHPDTTYAAQGRLAMARMYMDKGRDQDAADVLQGLVDMEGDSEIGLVGRLRLAKVLLYQDKADDVVALLEGHRDNAFSARYNELLGDAYVALGSFAEAETAYTEALSDPQGSRTLDTSLVQLKINDLPDADSVAASDPAMVTIDEANDSAAEQPVDAAEEMPEEEMLEETNEDDTQQ